ncbi:DUF4494 domain-containing protein [uncultured Christiangramia sp.]|uniref:DUF4494 domain-containing protein n=1 Tax=uncultured Christiangramia sp. TaxID=503836 RepID=UPI0025D85FAD|nr:DUF4494 domain-containing protein [uncultured Christiangramia sp.]|tara:strand:- start:3636 stop:4166 length:531 start_codon:yes stop_codon:yes gene_type:complete
MSVVWYECKVKYRKTHETGESKVTTETYLLDAVSYTEAEARITEEMKTYTSEEFMITNIKVANLSEVHPFENSDRWFKSKVSLISYDDESGKERKSNLYMLIQANDVKQAYENTEQALQETMGDYSIPAITESPILDVFPYFSDEEEPTVDSEVTEEIEETEKSEVVEETEEVPSE